MTLRIVYSARREEKRPRQVRPGTGREPGGRWEDRGLRTARPRGRENPRSPPPAWPTAFTVPVEAQQTEATEAARDPLPSSRPAGSPHLDLPTPLSPMMRIFRVVSTSSPILTLLCSQPSWPPGVGSQPFTQEKCPRMHTTAHLTPSFLPGCLGCRSPGRPSSALRKLCACANSESQASFRGV